MYHISNGFLDGKWIHKLLKIIIMVQQMHINHGLPLTVEDQFFRKEIQCVELAPLHVRGAPSLMILVDLAFWQLVDRSLLLSTNLPAML